VTCTRARAHDREGGFTIIELTISLGLLALIGAAMSGVFWTAIRAAGAANHRTDAAAIASREIEGMRAVPFGQAGFYADQTGYAANFEGFETVLLGPTSPAGGTLVPQIQPQRPDPSASGVFAPDPAAENASPIVQGNVVFTVRRDVVWLDAHDSSSTYTQAYKRLTVAVTWADQAGPHSVRQDSILYPGGQGKYQGPQGVTTTSSTPTTSALSPVAPVLSAITQLADPAGETQMALSWSQPGGGAPVTSYTIEYSTSSSFPAGNFSVVTGLAPSITSYTATGLTPNTTYYFKILAYGGANFATSNVQSQATLPVPGPTCTLGVLGVAGASSLSTTGTRLANSGKMSENLALAWTTAGTCTHSYTVKAFDPSNADDPGSPYVFTNNSGSYTATVFSNNQKGWSVGLHTFKVWDLTTNSATTVVKTFKVCVHSASSC
jgi:Tfp pilus assembly protein PilV